MVKLVVLVRYVCKICIRHKMLSFVLRLTFMAFRTLGLLARPNFNQSNSPQPELCHKVNFINIDAMATLYFGEELLELAIVFSILISVQIQYQHENQKDVTLNTLVYCIGKY